MQLHRTIATIAGTAAVIAAITTLRVSTNLLEPERDGSKTGSQAAPRFC